jgi:hypothetical protein
MYSNDLQDFIWNFLIWIITIQCSNSQYLCILWGTFPDLKGPRTFIKQVSIKEKDYNSTEGSVVARRPRTAPWHTRWVHHETVLRLGCQNTHHGGSRPAGRAMEGYENLAGSRCPPWSIFYFHKKWCGKNHPDFIINYTISSSLQMNLLFNYYLSLRKESRLATPLSLWLFLFPLLCLACWIYACFLVSCGGLWWIVFYWIILWSDVHNTLARSSETEQGCRDISVRT